MDERELFIQELIKVVLMAKPNFKGIEHITGDTEKLIVTCANDYQYSVVIDGDSLPAIIEDLVPILYK